MKYWKTALWLTLAGVGFRVLHFVLFANELVVGNDQMQNITLAKRFAAGDFYGVLDTYWTPLYPILIGIVTYFVNSLVLPSAILSIIAGSLAVTLTYFLTAQFYGQREAVIAAVIAIFYPQLINSTFAIGTESIYLLWIIGATLVAWKGFTQNSLRDYLLTGVLLGLAYLTRPEAIGYPFFFVSLIVVKNFWQRKLFSRETLASIGVLLLGFIILAAPYLFYLRSETGAWTISGKASVNIHTEDFLEAPLQESDGADTPKQGVYFQKGVAMLKIIAVNIIQIHLSFPYLLPILLLIPLALGLFGERWGKERLRQELYLISVCLITFLCYAATVVQTRYFYILLPIFFAWVARGIIELERWLNESLQSWKPDTPVNLLNSKTFTIACLVLIYLYALPLNFFMRTTEKAWQVTQYEQRDAGLWLKQNGKPSPVILSAIFRPVFYAEGRQLELKTANVAEITALMKNNQADYILTSERSLSRHPHLEGLTKNLQNSPEFELVYQNNQHPDYEISIFKLK